MLEELCAHLHNYFTAWRGVHTGTFRVEGGEIELPFLTAGQYFRILGSALNDGVYCYPAQGLADEVFYGEVWAMKVPRSLVALAAEIENWLALYGERAEGPYESESFGGYSYKLRDDARDWRRAFRRRLDRYRRLG